MTASVKAQKRAQRKAAKHKRKTRNPLEPLNDAQADYMDALEDCSQVFAIGGAGTGKTYIAARHAIRQVLDGNKQRLVIARPTVSKPKHQLGFLPGNLDEKLLPWLVPLMDAMKEETSPNEIQKLQKSGQLSFLSFEHLRGRSIKDAVIILDEAQNCDISDLRLFLTRIGKYSQVIICGDIDQVDIPDSGLDAVVDMVLDYNMSAEIIEFGDQDVVRSKIAAEWVRAFSKE